MYFQLLDKSIQVLQCTWRKVYLKIIRAFKMKVSKMEPVATELWEIHEGEITFNGNFK